MLYQSQLNNQNHETIHQRLHHSYNPITHLPTGAKLHQMVTEKRGRKPVKPELKKVSVHIYVEQYIVDSFGGIYETKSTLHNFLNQHYDRKAVRNYKLETRR